MSTTTTTYETAREHVSRFMLSRNNHSWEDHFQDAFVRWMEAGSKDLGTDRGVANYFIKATMNLQIQASDRETLERNAARTRYCNTPPVSPRYQMDGDLVFAIRNLHEQGYTSKQLAQASGLNYGVVTGIVSGRTYKCIT
tara:strand:- start:360 stop:779 length:420 start_codon:yes stop_codon:yes gene_type:complete